MAENSLSQAASFINDNSTICVGLTARNMPAVRSDVVAHHFGKSHKNVLRDIAKLRGKCPESFHQLNFEPMFIETQIGNGATRKDRAYLLTRDGFSLLVMGFTGAAAVRWKIRYIEAFNALEAAVAEDRASLAREAGYMQGMDEGRASVAPLLDEARGETARLFWRLGPARKRRLRSAVRYRRMGLGIAAIAKLLDVNNREISNLLDAAEALGLLPPRQKRPARSVQGNLLTLDTLTDGAASGSEQIDRPKGGEAVPVRAKRVTGIESRAKAARSSRLCRVNMDATPERGKEVEA